MTVTIHIPNDCDWEIEEEEDFEYEGPGVWCNCSICERFFYDPDGEEDEDHFCCDMCAEMGNELLDVLWTEPDEEWVNS